MWKSLKKSLVIYRTNDKFIGADEYGNKYFEREEGIKIAIAFNLLCYKIYFSHHDFQLCC